MSWHKCWQDCFDTPQLKWNGTVCWHWSQCRSAWERLGRRGLFEGNPNTQPLGLFIFESVKSIPAPTITTHAKIILWHASHLNSVSRCTSGDDVTKIVLAYQPFGWSRGGWGLQGLYPSTCLSARNHVQGTSSDKSGPGLAIKWTFKTYPFIIQVPNSKGYVTQLAWMPCCVCKG